MTTETRSAPPAAPPGAERPARLRGRAGIVFRKEFREIFRDKRTLFTVVISPLLLTPALLGLLGTVIGRQASQARVEAYPVGLAGAEAAPSIRKALQGAPNLRVETVSLSEAEQRVKSRRLRAAAVLPADAEARFRADRVVPVQLLVDAGSDSSQSAARRLRELFRERGLRVVAQRLQVRGLPPEMATPFRVTEKPIEGGGTQGTFMLALAIATRLFEKESVLLKA